MQNTANARLSSIEIRQRRSRLRDLLFAACVAGTALTALFFI